MVGIKQQTYAQSKLKLSYLIDNHLYSPMLASDITLVVHHRVVHLYVIHKLSTKLMCSAHFNQPVEIWDFIIQLVVLT